MKGITMKPSRHEISLTASQPTPTEVGTRYQLPHEDTLKLQEMSACDQELADYHGYPEIQAQNLRDRAAAAKETGEPRDQKEGLKPETFGMGFFREEVGVGAGRTAIKLTIA